MYKLITSDLDETLIGHDHLIHEQDELAVKAAKEKGVYFVCATGRPYTSITNSLTQLDLYEAGQYSISFNGGMITENKTNKVLHYEGLDFDIANALYKKGLEYDVCIHVYLKDCTYAYNFTEDEKEYVRGRQELIETFEKDLEFIRGQEVVKVLYTNTDHDYLLKIAGDLEYMTQDLDVSYSSNRYLEFNRKGVNKGAALRLLAEMLHIDIKDTIAVGDNYNDLTMIKAAGLGVGVSNTVEEMKKECDIVTDASCDTGAMKEVIDRYIFGAGE